MSCLCGSDVEIHEVSVKCEECFRAYHFRCVKLFEHQQYDVQSYKCCQCRPPNGKVNYKKRTNWHRYDWADPDADEKPIETGSVTFTRKLLSRSFLSSEEVVTTLHGSLLTKEYILENGFTTPILVNKTDGLGLIVPPNTYSLDSITAGIGKDRMVDVIDVGRQTDIKMSLGDFMTYFKGTKNQTKILNIISLEFSDTPLASYVEPPFIVRKICWVTNYWPLGSESIADKPQVSKYCLLSPAGSYTDFHVDFGGSSVWYHVLRGEKIFYLIPPTPENLSAYEAWNNSAKHYETFLGDLIPKCHKLVVHTGQTLFVPTGWIHAVLTTKDSVVFGGNFLHSFNIEMQLKVHELEKRTSAPQRFCFPRFEAINWYAGTELLEDLNEGLLVDKPASYLSGLKHLFYTLLVWGKDKEGVSRREPFPSNLSLNRFLPDLAVGLSKVETLLHTANQDPDRALRPPTYESHSMLPPARPMNGIEELLIASKFAGSPEPSESDDSRRSHVSSLQILQNKALRILRKYIPAPSKLPGKSETETLNSPFREAVEGMLSIGGSQPNDDDGFPGKRKTRNAARKRNYARGTDDVFKQVHIDEEFVYPSLEPDDDDEDATPRRRFSKRKSGKPSPQADGAWNPNIRVRGVLPRHERPARISAKKVAVEKVLEDARESEQHTVPRVNPANPVTEIRSYHAHERGKQLVTISYDFDKVGMHVPVEASEPSSSQDHLKRPKKGLATPKQRLGKILKIHKMFR